MKEFIKLLENRPGEDCEEGMIINLKLQGTYQELFTVVKFIKEYERGLENAP